MRSYVHVILGCLAGATAIVLASFLLGDTSGGRAFGAPVVFVHGWIGGSDDFRFADISISIVGAVLVWASIIYLVQQTNRRLLARIASLETDSVSSPALNKLNSDNEESPISAQGLIGMFWVAMAAISLIAALLDLDLWRLTYFHILSPILGIFVVRGERLASILLGSLLVYAGLVSAIPVYIGSVEFSESSLVSGILHFGSAAILFVGSSLQPSPENGSRSS